MAHDSPPPAPGPARGILAAVAITTGAVLPVFLVGTLAVQVQASLHFGTTRLGITVAVYYLVAAASSIPFGRVVEALGGTRVMRVCPVVAAVVMIVVALDVHGWGALTLAMVPAGMASSAAQPAANQFLSRTVATGRQGTAFGIKQAAIPLASLLAGLAVPAVALTVGWRWAFGGSAILAAAAVALVPPPPQSLRERRADLQSTPRVHQRVGAPLIVFAGAFALALMAASTLGTFLVTSAVDAGLAKGTAGFVAALAAAAGFTVRLVVGVQADRRGGRHFPVIAAMLAAGAAGYALVALGAALDSPGLFVPGATLAFGAGWGWNGLFNFAIVRTHTDRPAMATAVTQTGGRLGSVLGPLVFGFLVSHGSYQVAWGLDAFAALAAAAGMILGRRLLIAAPRPRSVGFG